MRSELLEELQELTHFFSSRSRVSSSEGIKESQDKVRKFLKGLGIPFAEEHSLRKVLRLIRTYPWTPP